MENNYMHACIATYIHMYICTYVATHVQMYLCMYMYMQLLPGVVEHKG